MGNNPRTGLVQYALQHQVNIQQGIFNPRVSQLPGGLGAQGLQRHHLCLGVFAQLSQFTGLVSRHQRIHHLVKSDAFHQVFQVMHGKFNAVIR